jgi:hypothetical protein
MPSPKMPEANTGGCNPVGTAVSSSSSARSGGVVARGRTLVIRRSRMAMLDRRFCRGRRAVVAADGALA